MWVSTSPLSPGFRCVEISIDDPAHYSTDGLIYIMFTNLVTCPIVFVACMTIIVFREREQQIMNTNNRELVTLDFTVYMLTWMVGYRDAFRKPKCIRVKGVEAKAMIYVRAKRWTKAKIYTTKATVCATWAKAMNPSSIKMATW